MKGFPKETSESDVYCTACPECHAIQWGNDWPPLREERFKCFYCGHEYTTEDLMTDEYGSQEFEANNTSKVHCPYYTFCEVTEWEKE